MSSPTTLRRWPLIVIVLVIWTLTTRGKFTVSGDEPHYLIIAESLLADHDLDLRVQAARILVPLTPLLVLPAASALQASALRWSAIPLLVFQLTITGLAWWHPRDLWPRELGTNQLLDRIPGVGHVYASWLPSILTGDSLIRGWACVATVIVLTAVVVAAAKRPATTPASLSR